MEFRILGPLDAVDDGRPAVLTGGKQKALLALLLLHAGRVLPVERLVDDLWGDEVPESARKMVQIFVSQLRKQLPDGSIETRPPGYRLVLDGHTFDLHRFEQLHARARDELAADGAEQAAETLRQALDLWRGPPLAEFQEPFARQEAARLAELQLTCLEERIDADLDLGRHADLVGELDVLVRRHPLRERLRGQQMLALYRSGRHPEALAAFQRFRRSLRDELGIEPSARMKDLERLVLQQDASLELVLEERQHAKGDAPARGQSAPAPADSLPAESRRTVTVLVADVTPRDAPDDPEARRAVLHERLREARRELARYGARVVPLGAGRLLAVFGVPVAQEDDSLRAVAAALGLRALAAHVRVGLASGEVVTGDPVVAGVPVDEATRLQERAAPGEVRATARAWRAVRHAATGEQRDGAWHIGTVDARAAPVPRRLETPLVGRQRELDEIAESFDRVVAGGRPHLVTVFGAPGLGKTRLWIECVERLRGRAVSAVAHGRAGSGAAAYSPLRDLLTTFADGDVVVWARDRLGEEEGAQLARQLAAAMGLAEGTAHAEDVALATRRLIAGLARRNPLLLVLEDAHWAAPFALDFVESLVELSHAPLLVLCLARPDLLDVRPHWGGGRVSSSTIMLDALTPAESDALLDSLSGDEPFGSAGRERILSVAEGNPLFIEQLLAAALEGEVDTLPDSIQTLLAGRLDRLDEVDRVVVEAAAVCGTSFATADVEALVDGDVSPSLVTLVRRELIRPGEADDPGGAGWSFRHSLIRDVAYASIPGRRRAELHERLGASPVGLRPDQDAFAAFHLDQALRSLLETGARGPDVDRLACEAAERLRRAGLAASDRGDVVAAWSLLSRANELLPRDARERVELLPKLGEMALWVEGAAATRALLDEAHEVAGELGDRRLAAHVRLMTDLTMMWTDMPVPPEQMLRDIEDAVPVLEESGDHEGLAIAELLRFHALDQSRLPGPEERLMIALGHAKQAASPQIHDRIVDWICITLPHGSVPVDLAIERVAGIRAESPSAHLHASALGALGLLRAARGELAEGRALVQQARRELEELGLRQAVAAHAIAVAEVEMLADDDAAAERVLRQAFDDVTALADQHSTVNVAWRLGLVLARRGEVDEAEYFACLARDAPLRGLWVDVWWRVVLALVEAHRGRTAQAVSLVREARDQVAASGGQESGMETDMLVESAEALRAAERPAEASELLAVAAGMARRLGYVVALRRAEDAQRALTV